METTIRLFGATLLNRGTSNLCTRLIQRIFFCHRVRVEVTLIQPKQPSASSLGPHPDQQSVHLACVHQRNQTIVDKSNFVEINTKLLIGV